MSVISIADRRAIMAASTAQTDFRNLMRRDPRAGFEQATGRPAPQDVRISIVEEQADAWEFVVPGTIEAELPEAADARGVIENNVYDILRDEPGVRARAIDNPKAFLADRLQFDMGDAGVNVREERPGELLLVLPYGDSRDELSEAALDLVAGGGDGDNGPQGYPTPGGPPPKHI